ncbi:hypothetical protein A1O3_07454 [Capronia epimyces CBS 606.96]|uniref:Transcription factor domain-containing protein n=1 Tax=Capronia epimyces CBS 606.96 TaxID=1182542 RepID=W9YFT5_9EURO|nr:uncharacterized protein A1O3_07454 [Capronia epimyces CBS 606.96]EXJ81164.1 hypothetical protein A1O3_07454 [Capronia epimyces CBS 606.96]
MASHNEISPKSFTFLLYNTPTHSAHHRRAVKSHVSSKYRTAVRLRQQALARHALYHHDDRVEDPRPNTEEVGPAVDERRGLTSSPLQKSSPLKMGFGGTRIDPFNSYPGQQTPCVAGALDYYTQVLSPLHQPLLVAVNVANPTMSWAFPVIMSHESAFHAAVALSQAYLEKARCSTASPSQEIYFHRYKAASILRDQLLKLEGPPDDGILVTVLALASLDVMYKQDHLSSRKGVALMVAMKGGLDNLGLRGIVKAFLIQFDYFWTLETRTQTIFPLSKPSKQRVYPQYPLQDPILSIISTLPSGFAAIARQGSLGVDIIHILSRVSMFLHFKTSKLPLVIEKDPVPEGQDYPDIFDACSCLHSAASTRHSLEKNICLAIILFSFDIHTPTDSHTTITAYRGSRQELTRSLSFTPHRNPDERACLIWIWMVVISSWRVNAALSHEGLSLSRMFCTKFEEARTWTSIETAMRRFFWYDPLSEGWKTTWREALSEYDTQDTRDMVRPTGSRSMVTCSPSIATSPTARQFPERSKPPLTSSRGTGGEGWSTGPEISDRTRYEPAGQTADGLEESAVVSPCTVQLPPMLTLETYLGQI